LSRRFTSTWRIRVLEDAPRVRVAPIEGGGAREIEQAVDERLEALGLADHALGTRPLRLRDLSGEQLRVAFERRERVLDLVRHDRGHLAERGEVPVLGELCLLHDGAARQAVEPAARQPQEHGRADRGEHCAARARLEVLRVRRHVLDDEVHGRPLLPALVRFRRRGRRCWSRFRSGGSIDGARAGRRSALRSLCVPSRKEPEHARGRVEREELVVRAREDMWIGDGRSGVREHSPVRRHERDPHESLALERLVHRFEARLAGCSLLARDAGEQDLSLPTAERVHPRDDPHVAPHGDRHDEQTGERRNGEEADEIARTAGHRVIRTGGMPRVNRSVPRPRLPRSSGSRRPRRA
jgi:hypothetical protein